MPGFFFFIQRPLLLTNKRMLMEVTHHNEKKNKRLTDVSSGLICSLSSRSSSIASQTAIKLLKPWKAWNRRLLTVLLIAASSLSQPPPIYARALKDASRWLTAPAAYHMREALCLTQSKRREVTKGGVWITKHLPFISMEPEWKRTQWQVHKNMTQTSKSITTLHF